MPAGQNIHVSYETLDQIFDSLDTEITKLRDYLSEPFVVTSLQGDTTGSIESVLSSLKNHMASVVSSLDSIKKSVNEVKETYKTKESKIQSGLNGSSGVRGNTMGNRTDMTM